MNGVDSSTDRAKSAVSELGSQAGRTGTHMEEMGQEAKSATNGVDSSAKRAGEAITELGSNASRTGSKMEEMGEEARSATRGIDSSAEEAASGIKQLGSASTSAGEKLKKWAMKPKKPHGKLKALRKKRQAQLDALVQQRKTAARISRH